MICDEAPQVDIRRHKGVGWPLVPSPKGGFIEVTGTPCRFGGMRLWFICPRCRRRCAIVYPPGLCRVCAGGRYASESLSPADRRMAKAYKIRDRLGRTSGGLFGPFPKRPKGMHRSTYARLVAAGRTIEEQIMLDAAARFGIPLDQVG